MPAVSPGLRGPRGLNRSPRARARAGAREPLELRLALALLHEAAEERDVVRPNLLRSDGGDGAAWLDKPQLSKHVSKIVERRRAGGIATDLLSAVLPSPTRLAVAVRAAHPASLEHLSQ